MKPTSNQPSIYLREEEEMRTNKQSRQRIVRISTLVTLFVIVLLGCSQHALGQWATNSNDISNTNSGNVGVGTTTPAYKLDILSSSNILARFRTSAAAHTQVLIDAPAGYNANLTLLQGGTTQWYLGNRSPNNRFSIVSTSEAEVFAILQNGNVGIGTANPAVQFHLLNASTAQGRIESSSAAAAVMDFKNLNRHWIVGAGTLAGGGDFSIYDANAALTRMFFDTSGNIGIGNTSPTARLDVSGTVNATGFTLNGSPFNSGQWTTSGTTINYAAGNVGLGTASPTTQLDVSGTINATALTVNGTPVNSSQWATSGTTINYASGNVGIGNTNPTAALDVTGDIKVSGNINAKYQDVAEWVPATHALPAGTVAVLNPNQSNQVMASAQAYDTRVAGVISERPGIMLGENGKDKVLVATTGRVRVRVDATRAPIHIGDLLVASDNEGMAKKSQPINVGGVEIHRPGTLIGKALEPLEKGTGEILVLLSLQ